jgi:hypothetical protein
VVGLLELGLRREVGHVGGGGRGVGSALKMVCCCLSWNRSVVREGTMSVMAERETLIGMRVHESSSRDTGDTAKIYQTWPTLLLLTFATVECTKSAPEAYLIQKLACQQLRSHSEVVMTAFPPTG